MNDLNAIKFDKNMITNISEVSFFAMASFRVDDFRSDQKPRVRQWSFVQWNHKRTIGNWCFIQWIEWY